MLPEIESWWDCERRAWIEGGTTPITCAVLWVAVGGAGGMRDRSGRVMVLVSDGDTDGDGLCSVGVSPCAIYCTISYTESMVRAPPAPRMGARRSWHCGGNDVMT